MNNDREITCDVEKDSVRLIDQKNNSIIQLAKVSWNGNTHKLDLRKWLIKGEEVIPQKGFSFLTEQGPHNLAEVLVKDGYGDTDKLQKYLNDRPNNIKEKSSDEKMYKSNTLLEVIKK